MIVLIITIILSMLPAAAEPEPVHAYWYDSMNAEIVWMQPDAAGACITRRDPTGVQVLLSCRNPDPGLNRFRLRAGATIFPLAVRTGDRLCIVYVGCSEPLPRNPYQFLADTRSPVVAVMLPGNTIRVTWTQEQAGPACLIDSDGLLHTCLDGGAGKQSIIDYQADGALRWQDGMSVCVVLTDKSPPQRLGCSESLFPPYVVLLPMMRQ